MNVLVYYLADAMYGLPLSIVRETILAVEVTPFPDAPEMIVGVINVRGEVMPVVDMRSALGLQTRETRLSDRLIVVHAGRQSAALLVDAISGVRELQENEILGAPLSVSSTSPTGNIAKQQDGLVLIQNSEEMLEPWRAAEREVPRLAA